MTATLYTIASIADVGSQLLRQSGHADVVRRGTFDEYWQQLYGDRAPDRFMWLNYGLLAATIVFIIGVLLAVTPSA